MLSSDTSRHRPRICKSREELNQKRRAGKMKFLIAAAGLAGCLAVFPLSAQITFTDVTPTAGFSQSTEANGVCVFDFNNDGLEDIFVASNNGANLLYKNVGGLRFQWVAGAGLSTAGPSRTAVAGDYDNDGYIDLVVTVDGAATKLFRNLGNETFADATPAGGLNQASVVEGAAWCDFDRDGFLDLYIANLTEANVLCHNNGDHSFTDLAAALNARGPLSGLVMGVGIIDYDRDGDDDILMAQDGNLGNVLLRHESNGAFTDVSLQAGVVVHVQGMGVAVGDYNRDGYTDFYTTNLNENSLFRNEGNGTFTETAAQAGVSDLPNSMGWGTFFFDADNDGWLDIYNNNQTGFGQVPNSFYHNQGNGQFEDTSAASGLQSWNDGIGSAYADFDNDGDLDIILAGRTALTAPLLLFRNDSNSGNHWIQFSLRATVSNMYAVGAVIELYSAAGAQVSAVQAGNGYCSQNSLRQHFGLGTLAAIDSVVVTWPGGERENFGTFPVDQHHTLVQGTAVTGIGADGGNPPAAFQLKANFPNPFNPTTTIAFDLPNASRITLVIYDVLGRKVKTLLDARAAAGHYTVQWNGNNDAGQPVASGVYFYRLSTSPSEGGLKGVSQTRKMMLIR